MPRQRTTSLVELSKLLSKSIKSTKKINIYDLPRFLIKRLKKLKSSMSCLTFASKSSFRKNIFVFSSVRFLCTIILHLSLKIITSLLQVLFFLEISSKSILCITKIINCIAFKFSESTTAVLIVILTFKISSENLFALYRCFFLIVLISSL